MLEHIDIARIVVMLVPLLLAVSVHEAAHGWMAFKMGDDTAARAGRISLNPWRHLDPFGSVILPLLLAVSGAPIILGYARPVPINFARLANYKKGTVAVSLAGVTANLICLAISGAIFRVLWGVLGGPASTPAAMISGPAGALLLMLAFSVIINAILAIFNLIPIPPLDGSRVVSVFLPLSLQKRLASLERFGIIILLILLVLKPGWVFGLIMFFIAPLLVLALGDQGLALLAHL